MDRLAGLDKYFKEKDRKKLDRIANEANSLGTPTMTLEEIRQSCVENGGYETPELNEKLYLHFRGFKKIENLEPYTGVKAIWLDSNGLPRIEGLDTCIELRCLYMSKNLINKVENLTNLKELIQLDLSSNRIQRLEGLSSLPHLDSLNLSRNALTTPESIEHLKECPVLRTLDVTNNRLEADEGFLEVFKAMPMLVTLQINGNEATKIQTFRKKMIYNIPALGYLDRPIEEQERIAANAFMTGGAEAEKLAREQWRLKQQKDRHDQMVSFREWQKEQQARRASMPAEQRTRIEVEDSVRATERATAANANHDMEQRALREIGIAKISQRVSYLEAHEQGGANAVNIAQRQLLAELDEERAAKGAASTSRVQELDDQGMPLPAPPAPPASSTNFDELDEDEDADIDVDDNVDMPPRPPGAPREPLSGSIPGYEYVTGSLSTPSYTVASSVDEGRQVPEFSQYTQAEEPVEEVLLPPPASKESDVDIAIREAKELAAKQLAAEEKAQKKKAQDEEYARQERVAESVAIYKAQKAAAAAAKNSTSVSQPAKPKVVESSWDSAVGLSTTAPPAQIVDNSDVIELPESGGSTSTDVSSNKQSLNATLYWGEDMDIILAKQVQACVFDFDRVSTEMIKRFSNENLTEEACRLRWADLDAGDQNALETNFTCYVTDKIIAGTKGHGAQPSFDSLSSMARGQFPAYLKAPAAFPSVADLSDDSDADDDKENGVGATSQAQAVDGGN